MCVCACEVMISLKTVFSDLVLKVTDTLLVMVTVTSIVLVTSRVDYCNAILAAAPKTTTDRLQRVLNAAA